MLEGQALTLGFIRRRPASAARVLASLPPTDAAAFLAAIPARIAALAMGQMNPWPAAQILQQEEAMDGAALIRELEYAVAAKILRLVPPQQRRPLLGELSRRLRRSFELSLSFPADSVGANMTTDIAMVTQADSPAEALEL